MYNYFLLIGYVSGVTEIKQTASGAKVLNMFIRVRRDFRDTTTGTYAWDTVKVSIWEMLAEIAADTAKKGSKVVAIGRVKPVKLTLKDDIMIDGNELYVDKLTVLDSPGEIEEGQPEYDDPVGP